MIVVVLGMHRSGTSVLAGSLHRSGVSMGLESTFLPRPNPQNPKGFFEEVQFRRLNDTVLRHSGYRTTSWDPKIPPLRPTASDRIRIRRLVRSRERMFDRWGWKDPRQMLTLAPWLEQLRAMGKFDRLRIVLVWRDPMVVGRSLARRGSVATPADGVDVWIAYHQVALDVLDQSDIPVLTETFDRLLGAPDDAFARIGTFLELDRVHWRDFVDIELDRSTRAGDEAVSGEARTMVERLRSRSA